MEPAEGAIEIRRAGDGKVVGEYHPDTQIYHQRKEKSKHMLKKPPAWAMDASIRDELEEMGCKAWHIHEKEEGHLWSLPFALVHSKGQVMKRDGKQIFVTSTWWTLTPERPAEEDTVELLGVLTGTITIPITSRTPTQHLLDLWGDGEIVVGEPDPNIAADPVAVVEWAIEESGMDKPPAWNRLEMFVDYLHVSEHPREDAWVQILSELSSVREVMEDELREAREIFDLITEYLDMAEVPDSGVFMSGGKRVAERELSLKERLKYALEELWQHAHAS